jgi:hypothetical protein
MIVLTDVLVADEDELAALPPGSRPLEVLPGADIKGVDIEDLIRLDRLLTVHDPVATPRHAILVEIGTPSQNGPWTYRLSSGLLSRLASLGSDAVQDTAVRWAAMQESLFEDWEIAEVARVVRDLAELARQARGRGKPLLVWVCPT